MKLIKGLLLLSLGANLWLAYHVIDAGAALADAHSEADHRRRQGTECMAVLRLDWLGRREADVLALPQRLKAQGAREDDLFIKREGDAVSVLDISYSMMDGRSGASSSTAMVPTPCQALAGNAQRALSSGDQAPETTGDQAQKQQSPRVPGA